MRVAKHRPRRRVVRRVALGATIVAGVFGIWMFRTTPRARDAIADWGTLGRATKGAGRIHDLAEAIVGPPPRILDPDRPSRRYSHICFCARQHREVPARGLPERQQNGRRRWMLPSSAQVSSS